MYSGEAGWLLRSRTGYFGEQLPKQTEGKQEMGIQQGERAGIFYGCSEDQVPLHKNLETKTVWLSWEAEGKESLELQEALGS